MEIKKPVKSKGVPKQNKNGTLLHEIMHTLSPSYGSKFVKNVNSSMEYFGYWDASLSAQMNILSNILFDMSSDTKQLIEILKYSNSEYLRGSASRVVYLNYSDNPQKCCSELRAVGKLDGVWPQEDAQVMLSKLAIKHSVKSILSITESWINDSNDRVRRLLIEAFRPRGVWKEHIKELKNDPSSLKPLLQKAIGDESLYVRKAAANNVNDISKENPNVVISWTKEWIKKSNKNETWSIKQGLRGLLRENNKDALAILGFNYSDSLQLKWIGKIQSKVKINTLIPLAIEIKNNGTAIRNLRLHMLLTAPGKGNRSRTKNFILATNTLKAKESKIFSKNFHFVDYNSTTRLPGEYTMTLYCNGKEMDKRSFIYRA